MPNSDRNFQPMRPRARLLHTLGRDLISSEKVALIELVKNSYDADASTVVIIFTDPLVAGGGGIDVWDDGHGMDSPTVTGTWFEIATPHRKKTTRTTLKNRRVLGEKGIGRLAASRLGETMSLTTRQAEADEISVIVDWTDFEPEDRYLDEVDIQWYARDAKTFAADGAADRTFAAAGLRTWASGHGTHIRIGNLTSDWSRKDLVDLRMALSRLVPPDVPIGRVDPELTIILQLPSEFEDLSGVVSSPPELGKSHYRLVGTIDRLGRANFVYSCHDGDDQEISVSFRNREGGSPQCGPLDLDIRVWDRDTDALRNLLPEASLRSVRQILTNASGISIYRDGFRVLPYGERGDDWLSMDARRVQNPTMRLSNNQVLGHIFISSDENDDLRDQSNREGLIDGPAFEDLQMLVTSALEQIEIRRYRSRRPEQKRSQPEGFFSKFNLKSVRDAVNERHPEDRLLISALEAKEADLKEGVEELEQVIARYSRLANMGMLIDRVVHDGRTAISHLANISRFALRDLQKTTLSGEQKIQVAVSGFEKSHYQIELLKSLFSSIEPFGGRRRGRPPEVSLLGMVERAVELSTHDANNAGIALRVTGEDFAVTMDESDIQQIVMNLTANAIYWTSTLPAAENKEVSVEVRRDADGSAIITVSDSGPGVRPEIADLIFDPYFSEKQNGVGLGLGIVGSAVSNYEGSLELIDRGPLPGASFRAKLRKRV
ncbi:sensor histidine kinase [uncultured Arthrobacter sp.]|uniref:sensor histidine kinase n=1 Tax=uncultured Arthrobacter sp. TaxID=114050 RepID=UPI003217EB39